MVGKSKSRSKSKHRSSKRHTHTKSRAKSSAGAGVFYGLKFTKVGTKVNKAGKRRPQYRFYLDSKAVTGANPVAAALKHFGNTGKSFTFTLRAKPSGTGVKMAVKHSAKYNIPTVKRMRKASK